MARPIAAYIEGFIHVLQTFKRSCTLDAVPLMDESAPRGGLFVNANNYTSAERCLRKEKKVGYKYIYRTPIRSVFDRLPYSMWCYCARWASVNSYE